MVAISIIILGANTARLLHFIGSDGA